MQIFKKGRLKYFIYFYYECCKCPFRKWIILKGPNFMFCYCAGKKSSTKGQELLIGGGKPNKNPATFPVNTAILFERLTRAE